MSTQASDLARRLAEHAETVCRHYLSNGRRAGRYWIVGDVRNTPGRSMFVRLKGPASGKGAAGKWTDAATGEHGDLLDVIRESCGLIDFHDVVGEARRFLSLPRPQPSPDCPHSETAAGTDRLTGIRPPSVRDVAADCGHDRRDVFAQTRHHGFARNPRSAISPALLLPARCRCPDRGLAGADRRRHRSRRQDHRRASHLARSIRPRQGARRHAAARHGSSPRARRPFRCRDRRHGSRRGPRDHALAAQRSAGPAHARRALGQSPRRHPLPGNASASLRRARPRSGRRPGRGNLDRAGAVRRDRGADAHAGARRFQRRPAPPRHR